ncbi:DNA polymerase III subunit delta' [Aquabacterium sp.]|uniref:DNA polymerase III subunit delta' n=1 Tax=Aquabacterium sp. TaxID=1872578 RepID=UPI0035AF5AAF
MEPSLATAATGFVGADYPWLDVPLGKALSTQHGHALLVHGPDGVGQFEFCLRLAQAWLCEHADRVPGAPACGVCASCHLVAAQVHPDLLVLVPEALREPLGWGAADNESADSGEEKKSKTKPSAEIKVDAVRRAVAFAQQTSARGCCKVIVIYPADRMNAVSANTLLKTLEEPPGAARFILGAGQVEGLLPTIRSRCQAFRLDLPDVSAAQNWLTQRGLKQPDVALAASGGEPLTALDHARQGLDADTWVKLPRLVQAGQAGPLANWPVALVVDTLQKLCLDLTLLSLGQAPRYFPANSLPKGIPTRRLVGWSGSLRKSRRQADHPLNALLQIENLVMQAQQALTGAVLPPT